MAKSLNRDALRACAPYRNVAHLPAAPLDPLAAGSAAQAQHFFAHGTITAPAAGNLNQQVVTFTVPDGHTATLKAVTFIYTGGNWTEGDATGLYFSLRRQPSGNYVRDFEQHPNTLGSYAGGPWPVIGGVPLDAGVTLEGLVSVPGGSGIDTGAGNFVYIALQGTYVPVQ